MEKPTTYENLAAKTMEIGRVFVGETAVDIAEAIAIGTLPGDAQKKISGNSRDPQFVSGFANAAVFSAASVVYPPLLALAAIEGLRGLGAMNMRKEESPIGALYLEIPYQVGKAVYKGAKKAKNYFADLYDEPKLELAKEHGYEPVEVTPK